MPDNTVYKWPWDTGLTENPDDEQLLATNFQLPSIPPGAGNTALNLASILGGLGLGLARPRVAPQALQSLAAVNAMQARDDAQQRMAMMQEAVKRRREAAQLIAPQLGIPPELAERLDPSELFQYASALKKDQPLFSGSLMDVAGQYGGGQELPTSIPRGGPPPVLPTTESLIEQTTSIPAQPPPSAPPQQAASVPTVAPSTAPPQVGQLPPLSPVLQSGQDITLSETRGGQSVSVPIKADVAAEQWIAKAQAQSGLTRSQAVQALIQRGGVIPQKVAQDAADESVIMDVLTNPQLANPKELVMNKVQQFPGANAEKTGQQLFRGVMAKNLDEIQTQRPSGGAQNFIDAYHSTMQSVGPYFTDPKLFDDYQKYLIGKTPTPENVNTMLTQFINTSKTFRTVADSYNEIQRLSEVSGPNQAIANIALVFAYMHVIDPNSTVREGEQAQVRNAAGVSEYVRNLYNRLLTGSTLTDSQKSQIVDATDRIMAGQLQGQVRLERNFSDIAKRHGIVPEDIVLDFMGPLRSLAKGRAATKAEFESSLMEAKGNVMHARRLLIEQGINPNLDFVGKPK